MAGAGLLIVFLIAANFGSTFVAIESTKETCTNNRVMTDTAGGVITTGGETTAAAPLYALIAMDEEALGRVRHLAISYNDAEYDGKRVENRLTIVKQKKVDALTVELTDPLGNTVLLEGFEAHLIQANGEKVLLCGAKATCASVQVLTPPSNSRPPPV